MIRMLLIAPFRKMADDFAEVFERHNRISTKAEYEVEQYTLDCIVEPDPENIRDVELDAEVVITRGLISTALRKKNFYVPVVEVPVAANDLIRAFHKARLEGPGETIAVTGARNMIMGAEDVAEILGIPIRTYEVRSQQDIEDVAARVQEDGFRILVGGIHTTECAARRGLKTVLLESGKESIWHAVTEAKRLAYLMRREEEKTERLTTVLDHSEEGIVVFDLGGRVQVFNQAAADAAASELVKGERFELSVFSSRLTLRGEPQGWLLTIQDISRIVQLETMIREKLHGHGHVARHSFPDIIGSSPRIRDAVGVARHYAATDSTVLIIGKTGTGKEIFAQSIHNGSGRRSGPFVAVNCAALPEPLLESELFGYAEGAFTGAAKGGKAGLFELAHRGTLFLDEVSEIDPSLQVKLLRVIQEKEIRRVGHDRIIPVDVRIVAATNRNLYDLVAAGTFREDLFYRLNVLELYLPELKERPEDIPPLVDYWMGQFDKGGRRSAPILDERAVRRLAEFDWPGNVRQLKNICERLFVLYRAACVGAEDVDRVVGAMASSPGNRREEERVGDDSIADRLRLEKKKRDAERILDALRRADFKKGAAADVLGISRASLWRKMKELGIS